jgi:hypothetical protein
MGEYRYLICSESEFAGVVAIKRGSLPKYLIWLPQFGSLGWKADYFYCVTLIRLNDYEMLERGAGLISQDDS